MNIFQLFFPKIIEQTSSTFNKKIQIMEVFSRRSLRVNGMTQSGSIVEDIYKRIIPILNNTNYQINTNKPINILVLGFGTGTFAKLIQQKYSQAKIVGIEIDKTIIDLGKKYFATDKITNLKLINDDAIKFVNSHYDTVPYHSRFDIIFVDLYRGEQIEAKVETTEFLEKIRELLSKNGVIIFNRLNFSSHKEKAQKFKARLETIFSQVTQLKSYSNIIFLGKK